MCFDSFVLQILPFSAIALLRRCYSLASLLGWIHHGRAILNDTRTSREGIAYHIRLEKIRWGYFIFFYPQIYQSHSRILSTLSIRARGVLRGPTEMCVPKRAKACRERARACRSVPRLCTLATFSVRSVHKINTPVKSISTTLLLYISIQYQKFLLPCDSVHTIIN